MIEAIIVVGSTVIDFEALPRFHKDEPNNGKAMLDIKKSKGGSDQ